MKKIILAVVACLAASNAQAGIVTKSIDYKDGAVSLQGTLTYDDALQGQRPGILLIPEWWGHNDYIKTRARQMAEKGYVAFALDMYGTGKVTEDPKIAGGWSKPFYDDRALMRSRAMAGLNILLAQQNVDKANIAIMGFCFGGTVALELARDGVDVKGVAAFHAGLQFPDIVQKGRVKARVLVQNGAADPMVPYADRQKFEEDMQSAGADFQFIDYANAIHAFTNPKADAIKQATGLAAIGYNQAAEQRSFTALDSFFKEIFGK